jgi:hypothetical protein
MPPEPNVPRSRGLGLPEVAPGGQDGGVIINNEHKSITLHDLSRGAPSIDLYIGNNELTARAP